MSEPHSVQDDFALLRRVLGSKGCDDLSSKSSDQADFALLRLEEQFGVLQEKARRFLVATGGPPEKIEDVGKARRELVDALHASSPASDPFDAGGQVTHVHDPASRLQ